MKDITLSQFKVDRVNYGDAEGSYTCKAKFSMQGMDFTIEVPKDLGEAIVAVCRGHIAGAAVKAVEKLTMLEEEK